MEKIAKRVRVYLHASQRWYWVECYSMYLPTYTCVSEREMLNVCVCVSMRERERERERESKCVGLIVILHKTDLSRSLL